MARLSSVLFPVLLSAVPLPAAERVLTLEEAHRLALRRSEILAARSASAEEVRGRVDELAALVRPRLALRGSELFREQAPANSRSDPGRRDQPEAKVSLEQPLFSGFRDLAVLKAGRSALRAADAEVLRAEHLLYSDVARAFYDLARLQQESATRDAVLSFTRDRLGEIRERERLGRSRKSERLSVESLAAELEAARAQEGRLEREAQRAVRFLTGLSEDVRPRVPESLPVPPSLEEARRAAEGRPDVTARREEMESARQALSAARREAWPVLDLDGNYYLKRAGAQEDVDWDVLFSAELPLYRGGAWTARKAQAAARLSAARVGHDLALRRALLEVEASHDRMYTLLEVLPTLERAAALADANAKAQAADYRLGLVTNLDVLNSLERQQQARLRLEEARLDTFLAAVQLQVDAGSLPPSR